MSDKPSFFSELKRRNVYKVAVAYTVVGVAADAGRQPVFPFFEIPNWIVRLVIFLLVIGFPVALIIAWAFEVTPQGIKRTEAADAAGQRSRGVRLDLCCPNRCSSLRRIVFSRPLYCWT